MSSKLRYVAIAFLIASVPFALMVLTARNAREPGMTPAPLAALVATGAVQWYPWAVLAPFIDRRVRRSRPASRRDYWTIAGGHVLLLLVFAIVHGTLTAVVDHAVFPGNRWPYSRAIVGELVPDAILYTAIVVVFTVAESRRRQTEVAERLRAEVAEARLDALRQQLNPHFLFNTLNHIVVQLRNREVDQALRMLLALGDLLRDVVRERAQLIPLSDEVRMLERYLEIERERFGDRLQAEVTFEPRALAALVPSLILQPLIENAVRHGVSTADGRCRLRVGARVTGNRLVIDVQDDGPGIDPSRPTSEPGVGLKNTAERLRYLYGSDHSLDLQASEHGGLLVSMNLPFRR